MKKQKVLKCVFSKKGKLLRIVPDTDKTKAKSMAYWKGYKHGKEDALDGKCIEIPPSTVEAWIDVGREQGKKESLLLCDAEKKALAKTIQKKWKLAYYGKIMFMDFDEYLRQLVRDLRS